MRFEVELTDIRPVKSLTFSIDLRRNAPLCIVGRNGSGKTTLAKAIMNFALADTFSRTNSNGSLSANSRLRYTVDGTKFEFSFDPAMDTLNSRRPVPQALRSQVSVELPIPHGQRFSYYQALAGGKDEIASAIYLENEIRPDALIAFLTRIYGDNRFEHLREVKFSRGPCCFYRVDDRYVREDSFSSGEFFLVNLYRRLQSGRRLIFIDEIDISLDAAAQARLVGELRMLCAQFGVNIVFTSHSLALMQTLEPGELLYLESGGERSILEERSFSYVKSLMFGFQGWDRYILVEDEAAKLVVQQLIDRHCLPIFNRVLILEVGGAGQVVSLLRRNRSQGFLAPVRHVIAILDGDQAQSGHAREDETYCMPLNTLEGAFEAAYDRPDFEPRLPPVTHASLPAVGRAKALFKQYRRAGLRTDQEIVEVACAPLAADLQSFAEQVLRPFLSMDRGAAHAPWS